MTELLETNKAFIRQFVEEVQNRHDVAAMDKFFSPKFVNYDIIAGLPDNLEGSKELHRILFTAFPDMRTVVHQQAADGDKVWTYKSAAGSHQGRLFHVPATGKQVSWKVIDIMTVRDKKITEHWVVSDFSNVIQFLEGVSSSGS